MTKNQRVLMTARVSEDPSGGQGSVTDLAAARRTLMKLYTIVALVGGSQVTLLAVNAGDLTEWFDRSRVTEQVTSHCPATPMFNVQ